MMDYISYYLVLIFLFKRGVAVPLINNTSWIKDLILTTNVVENSSIPAIPLLWHFNEKHYYLGTILKANYYESEQFCNYHGMRLVSILSKEENDFLGQKLYDSGFTGANDLFWTSGTRMADGEHWIWMTTGARIEFSNWAPGEPNFINKVESCLEVNRYKISTKKDLFWNDSNCASKLYLICEYTRPKSITNVINQLNKLLDFDDVRVIPDV